VIVFVFEGVVTRSMINDCVHAFSVEEGGAHGLFKDLTEIRLSFIHSFIQSPLKVKQAEEEANKQKWSKKNLSLLYVQKAEEEDK